MRTKIMRYFLLIIVVFATVATALAADPASPGDLAVSSLAKRQYLLGDWGGRRTRLAEDKGITFDFFLQSDMLSNVKGGADEGKLAGWNRARGTMDIDMAKLVHLSGMTFHVTGVWQGGVNLADARYLGSLATPSGNASVHLFRLDSMWVQQTLLNKQLTIAAGQISGMDFFGISPDLGHYTMEPLFYAPFALFNTYSSWDPATTPAAMVKYAPAKNWYYQTMIQAGNRKQIAQDDMGVRFAMKNGAVWNNELGFLIGQPDDKNPGQKTYPGHYRIGMSYNGSKFLNLKTSSMMDGNYLVYVMAKQAVWRPKANSSRGLDVRVDVVASPTTRGTLPYNKEVVVGAVFNGILSKRPKDSVNFGMNYYGVRSFLNTPANTLGGFPVTSEKAFEINYSAQATPFLQVMPVVQIYKDLGANPTRGTGVVAGVRTKVTF